MKFAQISPAASLWMKSTEVLEFKIMDSKINQTALEIIKYLKWKKQNVDVKNYLSS